MKKEEKSYIICSMRNIYKKISRLNLYTSLLSKTSKVKFNPERIKQDLLEVQNDINSLLEKF